jgi:hypothetical protein
VEYAVLAFFCGLSAGVIGKIKGSSFLIWFLIGLCLPLLGTLAALLYRWDRNEPRRTCPECGNVVKLHDQVCMRCGRDLEFPTVDSPSSVHPQT